MSLVVHRTRRPRLGTTSFIALSVGSRLVWAAITLGLIVVLPLTDYASFALTQLLAGLSGQLLLGPLNTLAAARLATVEDPAALVRGLLVLGSGLALLGGLGVAALDGVGAVQLTSSTAALVGLWVAASFVSALAQSRLLAAGQRSAAVVLGFVQAAAYLALLAAGFAATGEDASLAGALALLLPALVALSRDFTSARLDLSSALSLHRAALLVNAAAAPSLLLLWVIAAQVAAGPEHGIALYGLSNQLMALMLFLPSAISTMTVVALTQRSAADRRSLALMLLILSVATADVAWLLLETVLPLAGPLLPAVLHGHPIELALAIATAGLIAARFPLSWLGQVEGRTHIEAFAGIAFAAVLAVAMVAPVDSAFAMLLRALGALAALLVAALVLLRRPA